MKKRLDWAEHALSGFTSDSELIQLVLGDLNEEWHNLVAHRGRFAANMWYIHQLFRSALDLAAQWCCLASTRAVLTRIGMVFVVSSLSITVTTVSYNFSLFFANFAMGMFAAGSEGGDPLTINWNAIAITTQLIGVTCAFLGAFTLAACSRIAPMVSVMLLTPLLIGSTLLMPLASQAVLPLWSLISMPVAIGMATCLGGIAGLFLKTAKSAERLVP